MANLNELPLSPDEVGDVDVETVPTFASSFNPVPQPGLYLFRMPSAEAIFNCFDVRDTDKGQRIVAKLREEAALFCVTLDQYYDANISNAERTVMVKNRETGEKEPVAISDMAQLLRALKKIPQGKSNTAYGQALISAAGMEFKAEHQVTASCNNQRDIFRDGAVVKGKKGCGQKFRQEAYQPKQGKPILAIPRDPDDPKKFALKFTCTCGAELRCWGQLQGFRQAVGTKSEE